MSEYSGDKRDITGSAHRASANSENYFRQLTDTIPAIVWITDPSGYCTYLNQNWFEFTGQQEHQALGYGWLDATHPDDKQMSADIFLAANAAKKPFRIVYRLKRHDGQYRWCTDTGRPKFNAAGDYEGMIGTVVDIHDERMAAEKLRNISAHLQLATTASNAGTWQLDVKTQTLTWSEYHKKMWGYDPGQQNLVYEDWHKVIFPEDREDAFYQVARALETREQYEAVYRIKRAGDGVMRWMKSLGRYDYDANGDPLVLTGITIDITEERNAIEAIRQKEQKFRLLAENLPQIIWVSDFFGNHEYRSSRWIEYFGTDELEHGWISSCHPQDRERAESEWNRGKQEQRPFQFEVRLKDAHGNYRWHRSVAEPITDDQGTVVKWVGAFIDIHDMKTLEDQLNTLVARRTSELARSNEDLQQFAHVASHDLKEPVRKVKTFIDRLLHEFKDDLPEKAVNYLSRIDRASDRMQDMINGVLDFARIDTSRIEQQTIDFEDLLMKIREDLELVTTESKAQFIYSNLLPLKGTPILIYQLFYNLVSNSLKFIRPEVPPVVKISTQRIQLQPVDGTELGSFIRITVEDNGIGFPNSHAEDIFKTFTRLHSRDRFEGTGLGLALCRKIVDRHGGTIVAEGVEGKGAKFTIDLPD
ncbi:MAG: PAS domain-containing protein [Cyclobacteriaceae bacterium]|nr:PAS domain-containing protein [Cyclobacteriaceae bacterium]